MNLENQTLPTPIVDSPQITVTQTVDQKPKKGNFLVILLSVLLFLSLSIAGFFAYQTQNLTKELKNLRNEEIAQTPTPTPVATTDPNEGNSDDNIEIIKDLFKSRYVSLGLDPLKVKINEIILLGKYTDKYVVSYVPSIDYVGGGISVLVGKQNGKWIMPESGDENYCGWIKGSGTDEATMAFMGPTCKF